MATNYVDIYERAIAEFEDPFISASYNQNEVLFFKRMYNFLVNAIPLFTNPTSMIAKLNDRVEPSGVTELFDGNGSNVNFALSSTPASGAYFSYYVDGEYVDGSFNVGTNTATIASTALIGTENVSVEWYVPGQFNQTLDANEMNILACFLVSCWGEREKNFLLDIRRLLNDDSFKLSAESASIRGKHEWFYSMFEKANKLMNQYGWNLFYLAKKNQ